MHIAHLGSERWEVEELLVINGRQGFSGFVQLEVQLVCISYFHQYLLYQIIVLMFYGLWKYLLQLFIFLYPLLTIFAYYYYYIGFYMVAVERQMQNRERMMAESLRMAESGANSGEDV